MVGRTEFNVIQKTLNFYKKVISNFRRNKMAFRKNPSSKVQSELELAEYEGGIPIYINENKISVIVPLDEQGRAGILGNLPLGVERFNDDAGKPTGVTTPAPTTAPPVVIVTQNDTGVSFFSIEGAGTISTTGTFVVVAMGSTITVTGSVSNNTSFVVTSSSAGEIGVTGAIITESAGNSITITKP